MMMRRAGSASPEAISAERTRSRASDTALSGRPTMAKAGSPGTICTCTSTARASIPSKATVETRWTMPLPAAIEGSGKGGSVQEHYKNTGDADACLPREQARDTTAHVVLDQMFMICSYAADPLTPIFGGRRGQPHQRNSPND